MSEELEVWRMLAKGLREQSYTVGSGGRRRSAGLSSSDQRLFSDYSGRDVAAQINLLDDAIKYLRTSPRQPKPCVSLCWMIWVQVKTTKYSLAAGMAAHHERHPFDTALMLGDNIYPNGDAKLFKDKFERPNAELLRRGISFRAVLGNHDVRRRREAQMQYPKFNMNGQAYYSFVKGEGLVEFFALDTTNITPQQLRWLEEALKSSKAQWKLAYFHHPIYSSAITHGSDTKLRLQIEPLFAKYGVAAALSGHDHTYERTKPQRGVQYFVCGAGGQLRKGDLDRRTPFFAAGNDKVNSFMYFEVSSEKLSFWAMDPAGNTLDSGALTRACSIAPGK